MFKTKGETMSNINKIPGNDETVVVLSYQDHHEGWHCTGDLEESAVSETCTASQVAGVIINNDLKATTSWGDDLAIDVLRGQDMLDSYERGEEDFEYFVTAAIKENFWELDAIIECNTEQYDHKRGRCTVSSEVKVTLGNLKKASHAVSGWTASVEHNDGTFSIDL
jgi:hypothetical protein